MNIDLLDYSDYDILEWHWTCPRCKNRVGQSRYPMERLPEGVLRCHKCLTEIKVLSKVDSGRRRDMDIIYDAEIEIVRRPTRLELLDDRDSHAAHLLGKMEECREKLLGAAQDYQPSVPLAREMLRLAEQYDKHLTAYKDYLEAVGEEDGLEEAVAGHMGL